MSEKARNKCTIGKCDTPVTRNICEGCILKSNHVKSSLGIELVNPPVKDDRAV